MTPEFIEGMGQWKAGQGVIVTEWHDTKEAALAEFEELELQERYGGNARAAQQFEEYPG